MTIKKCNLTALLLCVEYNTTKTEHHTPTTRAPILNAGSLANLSYIWQATGRKNCSWLLAGGQRPGTWYVLLDTYKNWCCCHKSSWSFILRKCCCCHGCSCCASLFSHHCFVGVLICPQGPPTQQDT